MKPLLAFLKSNRSMSRKSALLGVLVKSTRKLHFRRSRLDLLLSLQYPWLE
jgi:hypothetical protein